MADLNEIIRGDRNFVERIGQLLPGFRGYFDRENRREADRMLRMFGTSKLDEMIAELHELTKAPKSCGTSCVTRTAATPASSPRSNGTGPTAWRESTSATKRSSPGSRRCSTDWRSPTFRSPSCGAS
jgi:hypothetical protein